MKLEGKHWSIIAMILTGVAIQLGTVQHGWSDVMTTGFVSGLLLQVGAAITALFTGKPGAEQELDRANQRADVATERADEAMAQPKKLDVTITQKTALLLLFCLLPIGAYAQTTTEQRVEDVASWVILGGSVAVDAAECRNETDVSRCLILLGVRNGVVAASAFTIKKLVHSPRPCAPFDCGSDAPYSNIISGHTAFTAASISHRWKSTGFAVSVPSTVLVAVFRRTSNKHDWIGVGSGALVGFAASFIR